MLESFVGYKGLVPRISYSRHFSVDNIASSENIRQETARFPSNIIFAGESVESPGQKKAHSGQVKPREVSSIELKSRGVPVTVSKDDTCGKKYLLPPPQKFKTTSANKSPRIKFSNDNSRRVDINPRSIFPSTCSECSELSRGFSSCKTSAPKEQVYLKFYCGNQEKKFQPTIEENIQMRPCSVKSNDEKEREKIINSWMQFFG